MGQEVAGLMFGIRVDDARLFGLRDEWEGVTLDARERFAQRFQDRRRYVRAEHRFIPRRDATGETFGFFVAVPFHGHELFCLAPERPITLSQVRASKAYRRARRGWRRFARFAEGKGLTLPKAELILAMAEVG